MKMICPECGTEYRPGFDSCFDCGVPLIHESEYQKMIDENDAEKERYRQMDIVTVHSVQGQPEADLIHSLLQANGIESFTRGRAVQSVHPFTVNGLGEIRIMVRQEDSERATGIIREFVENQDHGDPEA
jgi:hypothetical protein